MNICIKCQHCVVIDPLSPEFARCSINAERSVITGEYPKLKDLPYCKVERTPGSTCGPAGASYKEKIHE